MAQGSISQPFFKHIGSLCKLRYLLSGEIVMIGIFRGRQMGKYRGNTNIFWHLSSKVFQCFGCKSQTVHARIYFQVNGYFIAFCYFRHGLQTGQIKHNGLKTILHAACHILGARVHYHNWRLDSCFSQCYAFISKSHCEVINPNKLQGSGHFKTAAAIAKSLHHRHQAGFGCNRISEKTVIVPQCLKVYLQMGFMQLLFEHGMYFLEAKPP